MIDAHRDAGNGQLTGRLRHLGFDEDRLISHAEDCTAESSGPESGDIGCANQLVVARRDPFDGLQISLVASGVGHPTV